MAAQILFFFHSVYDDVKFGGNLDQLSTRIVVHHTGANIWLAPLIIKSNCKVNVRYFPFDEQECHLKFGSWTYDTTSLNMTDGKITTSIYYIIICQYRFNR